MKRGIAGLVIGLTLALTSTVFAQAEKGDQKPKIKDWALQQEVEAKWGGLYRKALIVNRRGEWYLVEYKPGTAREWVEHWRIRKVGDTEDPIGPAPPNPFWQPGANPPREKAGEPPKPFAAGLDDPAAMAEFQKAAQAEFEKFTPKVKPPEEFKKDAAFREANWRGATELKLAGAMSGAFKLAPDPAQKIVNPRPVPWSGASAEIFARITNLVVSRGTGRYAAVVHENEPPGATPARKLEKLDLSNGKSVGVFELSEKMALLDISADGKLVAAQSDLPGTPRSTRLDIFALDGAELKRKLVLFPYENEEWPPSQRLERAWIVGSEHVLTINDAGKLALWEINTGKAVYNAQIAERSTPAFSANEKQMAVQTADAVLILEPLTGKTLASLPLERNRTFSFSFSPSGQMLVGSSSGQIRVWDLRTGKLYREFWIARLGGILGVVDDGHALASRGILIDFERRIPLWNYQLDAFQAAAVAPDGTLWLHPRTRPRQMTPLTPFKLPTAEALAEAKKLNPDDLLVLKPGVKVAIVVNADAPEAQRQELIAVLKRRLIEQQLVVDDAAPIRLIAAIESRMVQRENFAIVRGQLALVKMDWPEQESKLTIEVDGKTAWEWKTVTSTTYLRPREGQTREQALAEHSKPNLDLLKQMPLPKYVPKPREPAWYGSSKL